MIFTKPSTVHPRGTRIRRSLVHGTLLTIALGALIAALPEVAKETIGTGTRRSISASGAAGHFSWHPSNPRQANTGSGVRNSSGSLHRPTSPCSARSMMASRLADPQGAML